MNAICENKSAEHKRKMSGCCIARRFFLQGFKLTSQKSTVGYCQGPLPPVCATRALAPLPPVLARVLPAAFLGCISVFILSSSQLPLRSRFLRSRIAAIQFPQPFLLKHIFLNPQSCSSYFSAVVSFHFLANNLSAAISCLHDVSAALFAMICLQPFPSSLFLAPQPFQWCCCGRSFHTIFG